MMKNNKQWFAIVAVILVGMALAALILRSGKTPDAHVEHGEHGEAEQTEEAMLVIKTAEPQHGESGHDHEKSHVVANQDSHEAEHMPQAAEIAKGPHGGKLFNQDDFAVEVTIFEKNTPPEFRIYTYQDGKPYESKASDIDVQLTRLGTKSQAISFVRENDYLKSTIEIVEPHSFKVVIDAKNGGKKVQFSYNQIEYRVNITDKQLLLNGIEVLTAGPAKIQTVLYLQGEIKRNADKSVHVVPRLGGVVEMVQANAGDKVRRGQLLAVISSQAIADLRSALLTAQKRVGLAQTTYVREKQLWEQKVSAQQDYLQAQNALQEAEIEASRVQAKLSAIGAGVGAKGQARYEIRSPIDGVITNKQLSLGQVVVENETIFEVADLSTVWAEVNIYAKDIGAVKVGQKVTVKASASAAKAVGVISYMSALVGEQSRTAMARVVLNNVDNTWLPGLPVNVESVSDEFEVPLAVSIEGLQAINDWTVVFGRYSEHFEARPLVLGRRDANNVEVLNGLSVGEQYAAGNSFIVKADIGKAGASHDH
jgi:membrane fusion protein, heavy metal efflux system